MGGDTSRHIGISISNSDNNIIIIILIIDEAMNKRKKIRRLEVEE
jgi:hypothetical protein